MPLHHVVIGDGATAGAFAETIPLCADDNLTIIGSQANALGRGLAYADHAPKSKWRHSYLLNSPLGAFGQDAIDWFARDWPHYKKEIAEYRSDWLAFNAEAIEAEDLGALYIPRSIYGNWLAERTNAALAKHHERGVKVVTRTALANSLTHDGKNFRITLSNGETIVADTVDVATGGPAPQRYGPDAGPTAFTTLYGNEGEIAESLKPGKVVTCFGNNAAMLDVLRFLQSVMDEKEIKLRVISRSELPEPIILTRPRRQPVKPNITGVFDSADKLLQEIEKEMNTFRAQGATIAELRPGYLAWASDKPLSTYLVSRDEQRKVMHQLEKMFRRGTHDVLADYERLKQAGQIEEIKASVDWVYAEAANKVRVRIISPDGSKVERQEEFVINTSGPGDQFAVDLLTSGMIRNGWLKMNKSKTGVIVGPRLETQVEGLRYLSPAVTEIGDEVLAFPLYDVCALPQRVHEANSIA